MSRYRFIDWHRGHAPVRELCAVLPVAPNSYCVWRQRRKQPAPARERAVVRAFQRHVRAEVYVEHRIGRGRIRRVLRAHGLHAQQPRTLLPRTTGSAHGRRVAAHRPGSGVSGRH